MRCTLIDMLVIRGSHVFCHIFAFVYEAMHACFVPAVPRVTVAWVGVMLVRFLVPVLAVPMMVTVLVLH